MARYRAVGQLYSHITANPTKIRVECLKFRHVHIYLRFWDKCKLATNFKIRARKVLECSPEVAPSCLSTSVWRACNLLYSSLSSDKWWDILAASSTKLRVNTEIMRGCLSLLKRKQNRRITFPFVDHGFGRNVKQRQENSKLIPGKLGLTISCFDYFWNRRWFPVAAIG